MLLTFIRGSMVFRWVDRHSSPASKHPLAELLQPPGQILIAHMNRMQKTENLYSKLQTKTATKRTSVPTVPSAAQANFLSLVAEEVKRQVMEEPLLWKNKKVWNMTTQTNLTACWRLRTWNGCEIRPGPMSNLCAEPHEADRSAS